MINLLNALWGNLFYTPIVVEEPSVESVASPASGPETSVEELTETSKQPTSLLVESLNIQEFLEIARPLPPTLSLKHPTKTRPLPARLTKLSVAPPAIPEIQEIKEEARLPEVVKVEKQRPKIIPTVGAGPQIILTNKDLAATKLRKHEN